MAALPVLAVQGLVRSWPHRPRRLARTSGRLVSILIAIRSNLGILARRLADNLELQEKIVREGGPSPPVADRLAA